MLRSLCDDLMRRLGYVRTVRCVVGAPQGADAPAVLVSQSAPVPAHRAAKSEFDYALSKLGSVAFWYSAGDDRYCFAVGKDDWMPLDLATFLMGDAYRDGESLAAEELSRELWLSGDDPEYLEWRADNAVVIGRLRSIDFERSDASPDFDISEGDFGKSWFVQMSRNCVSAEYRRCWRRVHIGGPACTVDDIGERFIELPVMAEARPL